VQVHKDGKTIKLFSRCVRAFCNRDAQSRVCGRCDDRLSPCLSSAADVLKATHTHQKLKRHHGHLRPHGDSDADRVYRRGTLHHRRRAAGVGLAGWPF
jgi:hypothetical protein